MTSFGVQVPPELLGAFRHLLTVGAGALVAHGVLEESMTEPLVGGIIAIATVAWSMYAKKRGSSEATKVAVNVMEGRAMKGEVMEPISKEDS